MTRGGDVPYPQAPIALRRVVDPQHLRLHNPCDGTHILGSFWPNSRTSFESHVVKSFKECNPTRDFEPHISELCRFYSGLIGGVLGDLPVSAVVRVLSSAEREPEPCRPQSLLVDILCQMLHAENVSTLFFKSESRPSMRSVKRLSGPDALAERIHYLIQDLFVRPQRLGGTVLLLDDIYNTGASARAYGWALREYAGVERVVSVNLAATRFGGGRDGHGMLKLDTSTLGRCKGLDRVYSDRNSCYHLTDTCEAIEPPVTAELRFFAEGKSAPCPKCIVGPTRRWWQVGRRNSS